MIPGLHSENTGLVTGTLSPLHNGQPTGVKILHFQTQSANLTVQASSKTDALWEQWNIDGNQPDKISFYCDGYPLAIICSLQGSAEWTTPSKARKILHERSVNGIISTGAFQRITVRKNTKLSFLIIRYPAATLAKYQLRLDNTDRFFRSHSLILDRERMDWLNSPTTSSMLLEWLIKDHPNRLCQPKTISLDEATWFYLEKNRLLQCIHLHLPCPELLAYAGVLQPDRFKRRLRQLYGICLRELIAEARINAAQQLLRENEHPIKKIAQLTGFPNVHYFTRVFTKMMGVPPGLYQERYGL